MLAWLPSRPTAVSAHSPLTVSRPMTVRPRSVKNAIVASRSRTAIPTFSSLMAMRCMLTSRADERDIKASLAASTPAYVRHALAAVAQRAGQTVHRQQDSALHQLVVIAGAVTPQQLDLQVVQRLQVRETVEHRPGQRRVIGEQIVLTRNQLVRVDASLVLSGDLVEPPLPERLVVDQLGVSGGQAQIGLREHLGHVRQHGLEERPALIQVTQFLEASVAAGDPVLDSRAGPVPTGQHHP